MEPHKQQQGRQQGQQAAGQLHPLVPGAGDGQGHRQRALGGVLQVGHGLLHHVPGAQKGEDHNTAQAVFPAGHQNLPQGRPGGGPVQPGGLQNLIGHRPEALGHEEGAQGGEQGRQHQGPLGVQQVQGLQHAEVGHQSHLQGQHHHHQQQEEPQPLPGKVVLGKAQPRQDGQQHLAPYDPGAEAQGAPEHQQVLRGGEKHLVHRQQGKSPGLGEQGPLEHLEKRRQNHGEQQRRQRAGEDPHHRGTTSCHDRAASFRSTHRAHRPSPRAMTRNSSTLATLRRW